VIEEKTSEIIQKIVKTEENHEVGSTIDTAGKPGGAASSAHSSKRDRKQVLQAVPEKETREKVTKEPGGEEVSLAEQ